jgi:hypothetical protein
MSELVQRMLSADLAVKRAREVFSERRAGRPGEWKKVHLTFDEIALILLQTLNDPRNLGDRK